MILINPLHLVQSPNINGLIIIFSQVEYLKKQRTTHKKSPNLHSDFFLLKGHQLLSDT